MIIGGFQKTSLIDYPDKISAVVFTQGCNFKCGYCHNPELIEAEDSLVDEDSILKFLEFRIGKIDAVVITGGEPTLQKGLIEFIKKIKKMGYLIKLDTNGSSPEVISKLLKEKLIDYIAMDVKSPLEKYKDIANSNINTDLIKQSISFIINSDIDYEFRTTVLKSQLTREDFEKIEILISGAKNYYLQQFVASKILNPIFLREKNYTIEEFTQIKELLNKSIKNVYVR